MNNMKTYINKILNILKKYNFDYLNEDLYNNKLELKIEYVGDDLIFKDRYLDFDNKHEYWDFANTQADIVCNNFKKGLKELKERKLTYPILDWEWDYDDYPCIYVYINTNILEKKASK